MANSYWVKQEKKFLRALKSVRIPGSDLDKVDNIIIKTSNDLKKIPDGGGCYWIWTNEPVIHTLHKHNLPSKINNGEIIYNGIAKDKVKGRISKHLFSSEDESWSGISMDIYKKIPTSHHKKAMLDKDKVTSSNKEKIPYIILPEIAKRKNTKKGIIRGDEIEVHKPIKSKDLLLKLNLNKSEKKYINSTDYKQYYFRNGINITDSKHKKNKFIVYYIAGLSSLYLEYIEKEWRKNGLPRLCSYSTGR